LPGIEHIFVKQLPTPARVASVMSPTEEVLSQDQLNVLYYLQQFINGLDSEELGSFLQFVTGSSVMPDIVHITFNNLSGQLRRQIAHTCSSTLELSCT